MPNPPDSESAVGIENTSPINSIYFTSSIRLATNSSVVKLWLMNATDSSNPLIFFEAAIANVNGKCWLRNKFKVSNDRKLDTEPEKRDPFTYNSRVGNGPNPLSWRYLLPHNLFIRSEEFDQAAWTIYPLVTNIVRQSNVAKVLPRTENEPLRLSVQALQIRVSATGSRRYLCQIICFQFGFARMSIHPYLSR